MTNETSTTDGAEAPDGDVADHPSEKDRPARHWWSGLVHDPALPPVPRISRWWKLNGVGAWFAVVFFTWSMTPSLLPRPWYLQAVATGICMAFGYAVAMTLAFVLRKLGFSPDWSDRTRRWGWIALAVVAVLEVPTILLLGSRWQSMTRDLVGMPGGDGWRWSLILPLSALIALALIGLGRVIIKLARIIARFGSRVVPPLPAKLIGAALAIVLTIFVLEDAVVPAIVAVGGKAAAATDQEMEPGVDRPDAPERSGSPDSPVAWEDLGRNGRAFVAGGPTAAELEEFSGVPATTPIRVYAGLGSGGDVVDIAAVVAAELERTGAFDRAVLAVSTSTGSGWVNGYTTQALEYLYNGDTAVAGMQYSYLPSPLAFIADRDTPPAAGRALFDAVYELWKELPVDDRPLLVTFGESLGSYGGQAAFSGAGDMVARSDGALWTGTPNFSEPWGRITDGRDKGSPERLPVVDYGAHVRFADVPEDLDGLGIWGDSRVVYLQHATDPIVWWSPDLLLRQPDWLKEDLASSVNPEMTWFPLVTFWQVTVDMVFSIETPDGYGHKYQQGTIDAWAAILEPEGWTDAETARLHEWVAQHRTG
ncbi:alpha/beta hydrolase [Sanguibacter suarezii]|uniref:alpha/beta hydrolase n=1 Tax=Sanguibacter suarezii TaxID=60921 RepID=UPI000B0F774E|nr:alpha/beta-hydrolase family protein [Sanguibacter suarezii]